VTIMRESVRRMKYPNEREGDRRQNERIKKKRLILTPPRFNSNKRETVTVPKRRFQNLGVKKKMFCPSGGKERRTNKGGTKKKKGQGSKKDHQRVKGVLSPSPLQGTIRKGESDRQDPRSKKRRPGRSLLRGRSREQRMELRREDS